jgi:amino acid adenylation domain-containing protein
MTQMNDRSFSPLAETAPQSTDTRLLLEHVVDNVFDLPGDPCIHQIVELWASKQAESIAVVDEKESVAYRELNGQANQIAHYLRRLGSTPEQPVAIYMEQSVRAVICMLGVLKAGSAYVPIETRYPLSRVTTILEEAGISLVLTQKALSAGLRDTSYTLVTIDEDWQEIAQEPQENLELEVTDRELAYIIFTSGTTGKPKGVEIEYRGLRNLVGWHQQAFQLTTHDKATLFASISFDASVWELWPYLCSGASVYVIPASAQASLLQLQNWLTENAITICFLPTPLAEQMIKLDWPSSLALRTLLTGGDRLHIYPPASLPFTLVNNYGPTENTAIATSGTVFPDPEARELPSLGKPISNVEIYILNDQLLPVAPGERGEMYIAGVSLARGYHNQPQLTQERFLPHPFSADPEARLYRTGDQACWNADGTITFLGRNDQQVKIRGFRIELGEIEARLASWSGLRESCAIAIPISPQEKQLVTFFVSEDGTAIAVDDLRNHLKAALPDYMIPARFVQLEKMPLLTSGKVDRQQLAALALPQVEQQETILSTNPTEQHLVQIWGDLLPGYKFGLHDDFFQIGGHSLSALQLVMRIREVFRVSITVRDLFLAPTIAELAQTIEQKQQLRKMR